MARAVWKIGMVLSVETRRGVFTLAQMVREPFLFFFDVFHTSNRWKKTALEEAEALFCVSVTRQFLKQSQIEKLRHVRPLRDLQVPDRWIHPSAQQARRMVAWGTPLERQAYLPTGASLVRKDVMGHRGGPYRHPSGVFDEVLVPSLSPTDEAIASRHEMTSLGIFPALNERLYLCHLLGRRVSPWVDIVLGRPIPQEFETYLDIVVPDRRMEWRWEDRECRHHLILLVKEQEIRWHWDEKTDAFHQTDQRPPQSGMLTMGLHEYQEQERQGQHSACPGEIREEIKKKIASTLQKAAEK